MYDEREVDLSGIVHATLQKDQYQCPVLHEGILIPSVRQRKEELLN